MTDLNRMDADVDALEIVDDAKDETAKSDDDSVKIEALKPTVPAVNQLDAKTEEGENESSEPIDELKIEFDTAKSLDDLQSQVLENVKDTLKSDAGALEAIENNQSEAFENPEDKLESDTVEKVIESVLTEELRNELKEDKLIANDDENSNTDNSQAENLDDSAKMLEQEAIGDTTTIQSSDDSVKSLVLDEDDAIDIDDNEMRSLLDNEENPVDVTDSDEGKK